MDKKEEEPTGEQPAQQMSDKEKSSQLASLFKTPQGSAEMAQAMELV